MPRTKTKALEPEENKEETPEESAPEDAVNTDNRNEVEVRYHDPVKGLTSRFFSIIVHGPDFVKTAKQFAEKFQGEIL